MNIIVRDIDPIAIKKLDELAKEKGISRQEFLKGQLETLAFFREENNREVHLQNIIEKNVLMMAQFDESIKKMNEFLSLMTQEEFV